MKKNEEDEEDPVHFFPIHKRIMKEFLLNRAYSYVIMMKIKKTVEKVWA